MKKILLAITHPDEWHQFISFNSYIGEVKKNYSYVIGILPYKPYIVMSEVDEIVTVADGDFFSYPEILNFNQRRNDEFLDKCVNYVLEIYGSENVEIVSWQDTKYHCGKVNELISVLGYYQTSFDYAKKFFSSGDVIRPTENVYNSIRERYQKNFDENTFILLTRNLQSKAPIHNTLNSLPQLENTIRFLTNNGLKIVNIGFPPQQYNVEQNYIEIHENFTQDELISMFYLSNGVITQGDAGGFATHFASNVDFYLLNEEWSISNRAVNISLVESKTTNKTIKLFNSSNDEILKLLKTNKRKQDISFSHPKKITFVSL